MERVLQQDGLVLRWSCTSWCCNRRGICLFSKLLKVVKTFKVMKKAESEPTVFGMGLIPLGISGATLVLSVLIIITARSVTLSISITVFFLLVVFISNYIYNSKIFERMSDQKHPKEIHNDIH